VSERAQRPVERLAVTVRARVEPDRQVSFDLRRGHREPQIRGRGPPREDGAQRRAVDGRLRCGRKRVLEVPPERRPHRRAREVGVQVPTVAE
jgi:hypothetical protein